MMKRTLTIIAILLVAGISVAKEYTPLIVDWKYPVKTNRMYSLDWDDDGVEEIFAFNSVSRGSKESYLYLSVLEPDGGLEFNTEIVGWGTYSATTYTAADERLYGAYAMDIDENGDLDLFVGSWITGGSLNIHKFYRVERITKEVDENVLHPLKLVWFYDGAGRMNDVDYLDGGILAGCLEDAAVYKFTPEGEVEWKSELEGAVWDILPVDVNGDMREDVLAGCFRSISAISSSGGLMWSYPTEDRIWGVSAGDLDGSPGNEVVGISEDDEVYILDSVGNLVNRFRVSGVSAGITIYDFDEDGKAEIILASSDRSLYAFNGDLNQDWNFSMSGLTNAWNYSPGERLESIYVMDNGAGEKMLLVGTSRALYSLRINQRYVDNEKAMKYYRLALESYVNRDVEGVIEYANIARDMFVGLNDNEGITECNNLLLWTENESLKDDRGLADEYLGKASELYQKGELRDALEYAENARKTYAKLSLFNGVMECDLLIADIRSSLDEMSREDLRGADLHLMNAKVRYDAGYYKEAITNAREAREIYMRFDNQSRVDDCDSIIQESEIMLDIRELYDKAAEYLDAGDYENSSRYAKNASILYLEVGDDDMAYKSGKIIERARRYMVAEEFYRKAVEFYDRGDYDGSIRNVGNAREVYAELNDTGGIDKCDFLLQEIDKKRNWYVGYVNYVIAAIFIIAIIAVFLHVKRQS